MLNRLRTLRFQIVRGLLVIGLVLFIVFLLQNTGQIRVSFLFFEGNIPSVIVILVTSLGGFAAGYLTAWNSRKLRRRTRRGSELRPALQAPGYIPEAPSRTLRWRAARGPCGR
jgi:uncharacterized integral membrane protein